MIKHFKFIDIIDLPSDPQGSLGKIRTDLIKAYNFNRMSPDKLKLLEKTLLHVVKEINLGLDKLVVDALQDNIEEIEGTPEVAPAATTLRAAVRTPKQET